MPLVLPLSTTTNAEPTACTSQCRRLTLGSFRGIVHSGRRPTETACWPISIRSPLGSTSAPAPDPPPPSFIRLVTVKRPAFRPLSTTISTDTGPMKW